MALYALNEINYDDDGDDDDDMSMLTFDKFFRIN